MRSAIISSNSTKTIPRHQELTETEELMSLTGGKNQTSSVHKDFVKNGTTPRLNSKHIKTWKR